MTSERGFSLVEVLIAIFVVVLSGVGTLKLYSYLEVEKANAQWFIEAKQIAETQLSLLQTINTTGSDCAGKTLDSIQTCKLGLDEDSRFSIDIEVSGTLSHEVSPGVTELYAKILNVSVSWNDRNGTQQSLTLPVSVSKFTNALN